LKEGNFKILLKNDMKYYLQSIVDQYYHRDILTSNDAEATFSIIKKRLSLQKLPLLTVIQYFINYSITWLINSTKIEISLLYEGRVNPFIGKLHNIILLKNKLNL